MAEVRNASAYRLDTHFGAYLFRENHFNPGGLVGFVTAELLDGYVDFSGNDALYDTVIAISGCLSTPEKWIDFDLAWQAFLKNAGFSPDRDGRYTFHATDVFNDKTSPFTKRERQTIERGLSEIIAQHTVYRFGRVLKLEDFREVVTEFSENNLVGTARSFITEETFLRNSAWAVTNGYTPTISYVFDRGEKEHRQLEGRVSVGIDILDNEPELLGESGYKTVRSVTAAPSAQFSGIQAADLIAWNSRRNMQTGRVRGSLFVSAVRPVPSMARIQDPVKSEFQVYEKDAIKNRIKAKMFHILMQMGHGELADTMLTSEHADDFIRFVQAVMTKVEQG